MDEDALRRLLLSVQRGDTAIDEALERLRRLPYETLGFATLDHHRALRKGFPEVVLAQGKTPEQVAEISARLAGNGPLLVTRASPEHYRAVRQLLPEATYHEVARCITLGSGQQPLRPGVTVVCAGTADLPVAEEARIAAEMLGSRAATLYDVGVAGVHRLLDRLDALVSSHVIVAVAGMEGALPGLVAGLVPCPVIAVPTSVGYGANLGGLSALLTMLNACAPGLAVVNIDNGFGAGYLAGVINRMLWEAREGR
ncbi:MAG: nickel pincer cofactor biosynthesis protein LarB [Dehalococcoidia bacterium]|jgi:NCAIR mutase (PurE)-related protein|nr:nickel pincer cofactor biosynthesis protein LarB [Dehalococcoidia bacterium]MDW8008301.1 nickel pincer cofactor biosynthesis protein LarB [Chloroflexota bacterium]